MRKILLGLMLGMMFIFSMPFLADAANKEITPEKEILIKYLEAVKSQDVDEAVEYVNDSRYESIEQQKEDYRDLFNKDKLVEYNIDENNKDSNSLVVTLNFENGKVSKVPFNIVSNKVSIDFDSIQTNEYEVIQEGTDTTIGLNAINLCEYNFWARSGGSTFYSDCVFGISGTSTLKLALTQDNDYSSTQTPGITYTITKHSWYGDDDWGYKYVSGSYTDPYTVTISGKSNSLSGAQIRFETKSHSYPVAYEGYGILYQ